MNKVVFALGASLGALTLSACSAQQEEAVAAETEAALPTETTDEAPAAIETAAPLEVADVKAHASTVAEMEAPDQGATSPAN